VVFAVRDLKSGASGSAYTLHNSQYQNHSCTIDEGVMQRECAEILKDFFNNKRK
jgi:tRNA(adenine34) deaminase